MTFVVGRAAVVVAAATTQYKVEHPRNTDINTGNVDTSKTRWPMVEICNGTTDMVFVAFDRVVGPPTGNGVQGSQTPTTGITGPIAATPGDFDYAICAGKQIDDNIPVGSVYFSVYSVAIGPTTISYGDIIRG